MPGEKTSCIPAAGAMAKTWEGDFPWRNLAPEDAPYTSPVRTYPPNGHGLYDMIGNVLGMDVRLVRPSHGTNKNMLLAPKPQGRRRGAKL